MNYFEKIINSYRNRGILIDSNLLLLYFIGTYNQAIIQKFKRTIKYTIDDYVLLASFIKSFTKVITTPNILTEVSNLCGNLPDELRADYFSEFAKQIEVLVEHYTPSLDISKFEHFKKYGLADSGIIDLVKGKYLVLSDDLRLVNYMLKKNIDAINFNNVRILNWS